VNPSIVILAGGLSSRMKNPAGPGAGVDEEMLRHIQERAKAMLPVGEGSRPFLDYLLYNIERAGYREVVIVTAEGDSSIRSHYGSDGRPAEFPRLSISYVTQFIPPGRKKPAGTADALLRALVARPGWRGGTFTVCNSDNLYSVDVLRKLLHEKHPNAMIGYDRDALGFPPGRTAHFSVVRSDERGALVGIVEKPTGAEIAAHLDEQGRVDVSMNIFRLAYDDIVPILESTTFHPVRDEKELPAAVTMLASSRPGSVAVLRVSERVPDLTSIPDIAEVRDSIGSQYPPPR